MKHVHASPLRKYRSKNTCHAKVKQGGNKNQGNFMFFPNEMSFRNLRGKEGRGLEIVKKTIKTQEPRGPGQPTTLCPPHTPPHTPHQPLSSHHKPGCMPGSGLSSCFSSSIPGPCRTSSATCCPLPAPRPLAGVAHQPRWRPPLPSACHHSSSVRAGSPSEPECASQSWLPRRLPSHMLCSHRDFDIVPTEGWDRYCLPLHLGGLVAMAEATP